MADLGTSIDQVFLSYEEPAGDDEVLIQPMLENVIRSGVAFHMILTLISPYRIINWSDGRIQQLLQGEQEAVHGYKQQSIHWTQHHPLIQSSPF